MRTIQQITGIPKETDTGLFPDSTIVNETSAQDGTPVVREIYGDVLVNLYKLLRETKTSANNQEDNEANGYQIIEALRKLTNTMNDAEQQLNLNGTAWQLPLDLDLIPDKYFVLCRPTADYNPLVTYTLKGTGATPVLGFTSAGFKQSDLVLLIIDQSGVRAYSLVQAVADAEVFTPFGTPLAFNDTAKVWYQSEGILFSDQPEAYDLQAAARTLASDGTLLVYEMILLGGYFITLCFSPTANTYTIYRVSAGAPGGAPSAMTLSGRSFPVGTDRRPNLYCDGTKIYITNGTGNTADDFTLDEFAINLGAGTLTYAGTLTMDAAFEKTTNAAAAGGKLLTFVNGVLRSYSLTNGAKTERGSYPGYMGVLFRMGASVYYSNGDVARKWNV